MIAELEDAQDLSSPRPATAIDCDVQLPAPTVPALRPYLPTYWCDYLRSAGFTGAHSAIRNSYPPILQRDAGWGGEETADGLSRYLGAAEASAPAGAHPQIFMCRVHTGLESIRHPDMSAALASAVNDWLADQVLTLDVRARGSIVVSPHEPELAAREIRRLGGNQRFAQVVLPVRFDQPYGERQFFPIYGAAAENGLVVAIHYGGFSVNPPTSIGWPSHYMEEYIGMPHVFQTQMASLILGGAFQEFPKLRIAFIDAGFAWLPSFMWRLDKDWKGLWREVPWVDRLPSRYVREHFRLTLSPLDGPQDATDMAQILEQMGSGSLLMYATGRPGSWAHEEATALLAMVPDGLRPGVIAGNAREFYPRL